MQCFATALLFLALDMFTEDDAHRNPGGAAHFMTWLRWVPSPTHVLHVLIVCASRSNHKTDRQWYYYASLLELFLLLMAVDVSNMRNLGARASRQRKPPA